MKCFNDKREHQDRGQLRQMLAVDSTYGEEIIVRWCPDCGCAFVDTEVDGRLMKSSMFVPKMVTNGSAI